MSLHTHAHRGRAEQRRLAGTVVLVSCLMGLAADAAAGGTVRVGSSEALYAALTNATTGGQVLLRPGTYRIDRPLTVPDHATLSSSGVMRYDGAGLPLGFEPGSETVLEVAAAFPGAALTLGNGTVLRGVVVRDLPPGADGNPRAGSVVLIASRSPGDVVAATIEECEIDNPNPFGFSDEGPTGHAILVATRNPRLHQPPPPHDGATAAVRVERSLIRATPRGGALFAINFASRGTVDVGLLGNRVTGVLLAGGGASRPDPVTHARVTIRSEGNRYGFPSAEPDARGWMLFGGSSAPHHQSAVQGGARFNLLRLESARDHIEGVNVGVLAAAGRRVLAVSGPISDNRLALDIDQLRVRTAGRDAADLRLSATLAEPDPAAGTEFPVGDRNTLEVRIDRSAGSGRRSNVYTVESGPSRPENLGTGNRIRFAGDAAGFAARNPGFEPPPPANVFGGQP